LGGGAHRLSVSVDVEPIGPGAATIDRLDGPDAL
jgi:hypothetical protein